MANSAKKKRVIKTGLVIAFVLSAMSLISAQDARSVARKVFPSVVMITTYDSAGRPVALGSGFFVRRNIVATNLHVLENAAAADVKLIGRSSIYDVVGVVAIDKGRDLVLLEVANIEGPPLTLGAPNQLEIGEEVYAVGSPKGLEGSISSGIISGGTRRIEGEDLIQITTPISSGSSGGPLVNKQGEVIGVTGSSLRDGQNLNFAVPVLYLVVLVKNISTAIPISSVTAQIKPLRESTKERPSIDSQADKCGDTPYPLAPSDHAVDYKYAGWRYFKAEAYDWAKEAYKRAIRLDQKDHDSYFQLAKIYSKLGCDEQSLLASKQAIILGPKEPQYRVYLGNTLRVLKRNEEAIAVYQEGIKLKPKYSDFYEGLGSAYINLGRYAEGIEALNTSVRLDPKNVWAHVHLGTGYAKIGNKEAAFQEYRILNTLDAYQAELLHKTLERIFGPQ